MWILMKRLADKEGKLVRILAWSRHTDGTLKHTGSMTPRINEALADTRMVPGNTQDQ